MKDFKDFWSINRWLCQYNIISAQTGEYVDDCIIVSPTTQSPYQSTRCFQYWSVNELEIWLNHLDSNTITLCSLEQSWKSGEICPTLELLIFPCANGEWYAAYPHNNPQYFVRVCTFSPPSWYRDRNWRAKLEKYLLENGQNYIASAARRIWLNILKDGALVKRANGSRTPPAPMNETKQFNRA